MVSIRDVAIITVTLMAHASSCTFHRRTLDTQQSHMHLASRVRYSGGVAACSSVLPPRPMSSPLGHPAAASGSAGRHGGTFATSRHLCRRGDTTATAAIPPLPADHRSNIRLPAAHPCAASRRRSGATWHQSHPTIMSSSACPQPAASEGDAILAAGAHDNRARVAARDRRDAAEPAGDRRQYYAMLCYAML